MIDVWIDDLTPGLKDNDTGESVEYGYGGVVTGYASNMDLVKHYCSVFHAEHLAMLHSYQIAIYEDEAAELRDIYDFEWTDEEV